MISDIIVISYKHHRCPNPFYDWRDSSSSKEISSSTKFSIPNPRSDLSKTTYEGYWYQDVVCVGDFHCAKDFKFFTATSNSKDYGCGTTLGIAPTKDQKPNIVSTLFE